MFDPGDIVARRPRSGGDQWGQTMTLELLERGCRMSVGELPLAAADRAVRREYRVVVDALPGLGIGVHQRRR